MTLPDGARLTWSCADGSRGRRWRGVATLEGVITHTSLIEVDRAGRPTRLELTTPAGLLTLHPSRDGLELHGNVVSTSDRPVRGLRFAWGPEHELDVLCRPLALAIGLHRRRDLAIGQNAEVDVVEVEADLSARPARRQVERTGQGSGRDTWLVRGTPGAPELRVELQPDGLPAGGSQEALETD
ncbi:MAG: hypothetical protein ACHQXL_09090 [Candidatus Limnocylindrales bacterium]